MKIERQLQGTLNTVFTELIKEKELENRIQPYTSQEEHRADITLKNKNGKPIFFIELKDPTARDGKSVFDGNVLIREAERAQRIEIQYFGNCNFLACAFFDVQKFYDKVSVNEGFFTIADITKLSTNYVPGKDILNKLRSIAEFYLARAVEILDRKPIQFSELDELFIFKIRKLIEVYAPPITDKIWERYRNNKKFERDISHYAQEQLWNKPTRYDEIEDLSYISLLMLISKLIFYKTYVDNQTWHDLHPMQVGDDINTPEQLETLIWKYFEEFKEITGNFELLIGEPSDIIFQIPFASDAVIDLVKDVLDTEGHYNFGKIPFDIIGRIFEELIREDERHKLGQYFTPPHVIDLINVFAIHKSDDKVFDPSCGSGTFLVRAYERKKQLCEEENKGARHEVLLNEIYGNDLSGYPAYLSMLNLAIRNTRKPSYPRIANKDFFAITTGSKISLHDQKGTIEKKPLPKFDAIIGNPPYTRQEDIGIMNGTQSKDKIQKLIKTECYHEPSQRTSIYAYFFYHAGAFLKEEGYLAYIVQNSWLDTDYGADLQRYLLNNYEIVSVMDSEVERFFPSAAVNTTIVILRKQSDEVKRNATVVKFIYFSKKLSDVIKYYKGVENLRDFILEIESNTVTNNCKLNCIKQEELSNHIKWSQFLKAPEVYFDLLKKGDDKWKILSEVANVRFGIKTGCNEFFIVKDITHKGKEELLNAVVNNIDNYKSFKAVEQDELRLVMNGFKELWLIEAQFLEPMLTSPKDVGKYEVESFELPYSILLTGSDKLKLKKESPYLFSYIQYAEKQNLHHRSSLSARSLWYSLGEKKLPDMSFNYIINEYGRTFKVSAYTNNNFHNIYVKNNKAKSIWLYMNSTICFLIQQLIMRSNLGEGAGKIETYELAAFSILDLDLEDVQIDLGNTKNYKDEFGNLASLGTVNPERVKLDSAILEFIGYINKAEREEVLLELYKATYQMIEARLSKAQSLNSVKSQRNKVGITVYVEQLKSLLIEESIPAKNTITFAKQLDKLINQITADSKIQKSIFNTYWKERFGEIYNEKKVIDSMQGKMF